MKQVLLYILTVLMLPVSVLAEQNNEQLWQKANNFYNQKNYDSAAANYTQIAKLQPYNAQVYYNQGNTYYRLNDVSNSILFYERALKIKPGYKEATDNLYLAQNRINNRIQNIPEIFFIRWWHNITRANLSDIYAIVAILLFVCIMVYFIARRTGKTTLHIHSRITTAVITISFVFVVLSLFAAFRATDDNAAIVMQEGTSLMAEPKYGKSLSLIPAGTKVIICNEQTTWLEVRLPDGRTGWMQQDAITRI